MKNSIVLSLLFSVWMVGGLNAQVDQPASTSSTSWSIFWNGSLTLESGDFNDRDLTLIGFGANVRKVFDSGLGIEAKFSFRRWNELRRTLILAMAGPSYTLSSNGKTALSIRAAAGPELIVGNDYSSVFAGFEIGPEVRLGVGDHHAVIIGLSFAQAMSFHPDHFEYLDFYIGWQF